MTTTKLTAEESARLGAALRRARDRAEVSREALCRRIDLSTSRLQHYEQGFHKVRGKKVPDTPPQAMLRLIAQELGVTVESLFAEAGLAVDAVPDLAPMSAEESAEVVRIYAEDGRAAQSAERAARVSIHIETYREAWMDLIASLTPDAKEKMLLLLANGQVSQVDA